MEKAQRVHEDALRTLSRLHALPVHDTAERGRIYREELTGLAAYRSLKAAMDLWCACWFWPADELDHAPLSTTLADPPEETLAIARQVAEQIRFFHWELEFPDVFRQAGSGFDALVGNPPWDIAKPSSKEFFSNIDPLYRSYGKQEALRAQSDYFADRQIEHEWIDYSANFRAQSNFMSYAASPFGDPAENEKSTDRFSIWRGKKNQAAHDRWRSTRMKSHGFADPAHSFRHHGAADINLYKLFLEQAHTLLRNRGRMGFIVPSGLYSDHGTGSLRRLFLDQCRWEWLFGFENREGIFEIHRSYKFNPVIITKGGRTDAIQTAFMRRRLEDWDRAEAFATPYTLEQVERFSPNSKAFLEITSKSDVALLSIIFSNSLPAANSGLGARKMVFSKGDFDMVSGSKFFHPRDVSKVSDAVSMWYDEQGKRLIPLYEGRMVGAFDCSQKGWRRGRGRSSVWREISVEEGVIEPQWLIDEADYSAYGRGLRGARVGFIRVTANTNARTMYACLLPRYPTGFTACQLQTSDSTWSGALELTSILNSFVFDFVTRRRVCGLDIAWFHLQELPIPQSLILRTRGILKFSAMLSLTQPALSEAKVALHGLAVVKNQFKAAITGAERLRLQCILDALVASVFGLNAGSLRIVLIACDFPKGFAPRRSDEKVKLSKAFWRVDNDKDPELRQTVLTLIAFHDLEEKIRECGGDREKGIGAFLNQNDGEGWMLPDTLRLADYGLGHDDRAKIHQPVASRLGPRFYDWQLAQTPEESWRECHLHARNLLGLDGYINLLADVLRDSPPGGWHDALAFACDLNTKEVLLNVFAAALSRIPPDTWEPRLNEAQSIMSQRGFPLDPPDIIELLANTVKQIPEDERPPVLSAIKGIIGDAAASKLIADLDAVTPDMVLEPSAPYEPSTKKMTQMGLFD